MTDTSLTLTFLGTSHGVPDVDRYCSSTLLDGENSSEPSKKLEN